jgi:integrase
MASIQKRPDGRWRARYRDPDGKEHAHHATTKAAAQRWLDAETAKIVTNSWVDPRAGKVTVGEYATEWRARRVWAPATADRIDREFRLHILPTFANRPLVSLRRAQIEEWVTGLPLAASSARMVFETLSNLLSAAVDDDRLAKNPAKGARLARDDAPPFVPLTTQEVNMLADETLEHVRAAVVLVAGTGLRQGELFGLAVDRVDFLRRELRVDQQLWTPARGGPVLKTPKSRNSYRTVALSPLVLEHLADHFAAYGIGQDGLMFHTAGRPVGRAMASKYLRTAAVAAGLEGRTWHDLRHFHASTLLSRGVSPAYVAERLGHDVKTLLATYAHVIRADEDRVRRIVDETLNADSADFSRTAEG